MDHDRRTETSLVTERAPLESHCYGLLYAVADYSTARSLHAERTLEDCRKHSRNRTDMCKYDDQRTDYVKDCHDRDKFFRNTCHTLKSTKNDH